MAFQAVIKLSSQLFVTEMEAGFAEQGGVTQRCAAAGITHILQPQMLAPNPDLQHFTTLTLIKDFLSAFLSLSVNFCHLPALMPSQPPLSHVVCSHTRLFLPEDPPPSPGPAPARGGGGPSSRPAAMAAAMATTAGPSATCGLREREVLNG